MPFAIIVAMDQDRGIGREARLPWHLKGDLRHFYETTKTTRDRDKRNVVIMGRRTWDSIPAPFRPLPDRINVVITANKSLEFPKGVFCASRLADALALTQKQILEGMVESVYVIGGAQIYQQAIQHPQCRKIYLTQILNSFDCDTFFPVFTDRFQQESVSPKRVEGNLAYFFAEYVR